MHRRETKKIELSSDDDAGDHDPAEFLREATSRRRDERQHGTRKLHEFAFKSRFDDDSLDGVLNLCASGVADESRTATERQQLVVIGSLVIMRGDAPEGFAVEFADVLVAALPKMIAAAEGAEEDDAEDIRGLCITALDAIIVAEAVEGNAIRKGDDLLSDTLVAIPLPTNPQLAVAFCRCVAVVADDASQADGVDCLLQDALERFGENLVALNGIVKCVAIAVETHEELPSTPAQVIDALEGVDNKLPGGKDARKELASTVRTVGRFMHTGEKPEHTVNVVIPGSRGESITIDVSSFVLSAVLHAMRAIAGDKYYEALLTSPAMATVFDFEVPADETALAKQIRLGQERLEARYGQAITAKSRSRNRAAARDRKNAI